MCPTKFTLGCQSLEIEVGCPMHYNSPYVPLENGWHCILVPPRDYRSPSGDTLWFMNDDDERRQLAQDRRDFHRHFRPTFGSTLSVTDQSTLSEIQGYLRDLLSVVPWDLPTDGAGVERILRDAVTSERLVPIIKRDWRGLPRVYRPAPAPERWPATGGGGGAVHVVPYGSSSRLRSREPILSGPYDPASRTALLAAARRSIDVTPRSLGDAQPFEYAAAKVSDDAEELAATTSNPGHAAKMLGYDRDVFGRMIHVMKDANGLRGNDNVTWHDNGDVHFRGEWIDNMHNYGGRD